jgi:hypothetical protein
MHLLLSLSLLTFAMAAETQRFSHPFAGSTVTIYCPTPREPLNVGSMLAYGALGVGGLLAGRQYQLNRRRWEQEKKMWADAAAEDEKSTCTT